MARRDADHESPTTVRVVPLADILVGGAILPGFRLSMAELFEVELG